MQRLHTQSILLLIAMASSTALANTPDAAIATGIESARSEFKLSAATALAASNPRTEKRATPVYLASGYGSGQKDDHWGVGYPNPRPSTTGHLVYTQSRPLTEHPEKKEVYSGYISGRGNPDEMLNNNRRHIDSRISQGFSPPKLIQYHNREIEAVSHVHDLREQDRKTGRLDYYRSGVFPASRD